VIVLFPSLSAYGDTNNTELLVVDGNEDPINSWGLHIEIYSEKDRKTPILKLDQPPNPSDVSLENGKYIINVYRHDMFVGNSFLNLDGSVDTVRIPIAGLGGVLFNVHFKDSKPIQGAKVEIFSYKGTKWAEDITGIDGRTERFWLQIPIEPDEYYSVKISLNDEVSYEVSPFRFSKGIMNELITTPWKSIVDDQVKIQLYKNKKAPISGYDGEFVVELYDNKNEKVAESKVNNHGEAVFSNLPVGFYFLRVLELNADSDPTVWSIKQILVHNDVDEIKIFGLEETNIDDVVDKIKSKPKIESPEKTCNCVAFRLDNVQDYYLSDVQKELINLFLSKDAPITLGIIGKNFGSDVELINFLKSTASEHEKLIAIGNHGGTTDITTMNEDEQFELITNTNNNISNLIEKKPSVFIPLFGSYNADTLPVLERSGMKYISSVSSFDVGPYPFKDVSVFRFPATTSTGYIEQGRAWYGISANQTMSDIKFSIRDYGFAVVLLHPQEYSQRNGWVFENQIDIPQYFELDELIDEVKDYGLKIVSIDNIDREAQLFSSTSIPNWFKTSTSWWTEDKTTNSDFLQSIEYLMEKKIILVPQIDRDRKSTGDNIPVVFKNNARLWAEDRISDEDFVAEIEVLVKQGVIQVSK